MAVATLATIIGWFLLTTQAATATVSADTDTTTTTTNDNGGFQLWANDSVRFGEFGFGGGTGFGRGHGRGFEAGLGGCGPIEVSSEFEQTVINIAKNDTDVQQLLNEGYNVTGITPSIKTVVDGEGNVVTKATSAVVMLEKDTTGLASVLVDVEEAKVTQIVIITRTIIEKP